MTTVNISISQDQASFIDRLVSVHGFTNRSEFIRSLLRLIKIQPDILEKASVYPFVSPQEKSVKKVVSSFAATNKYSKDFLKDLKEGLSKSDYFKP